MGWSFKAPRRNDMEQWRKVEKLWVHGYRFDGANRHPEAEKYPKRLREVDDFIQRNPDHPLKFKER